MKKLLTAIFLIIFITWGIFWFQHKNAENRDEATAAPLITTEDHMEGEAPFEEDPLSIPGTVEISPQRQQVIGVRIGSVEKSLQHFTLRTLGRVAADETRVYRINAAVDGWIRKTFDNATGSLVKKNERLATFYSPDFLSAEQAYIYALNSLSRFRSHGKERPSQISLTRLNVQQYKDTLSNLGMGELQIKKLARTLVYTEDIDITSPVTGFILARSVSPGERFEKGREMYRVADLSHIWILADLFEKEPYDLKPGSRVKVSVPYQKREFVATVSDILPVFDGPSRTLKVRMETDNPGYFLRPDMFVDIEIPVELPTAITVPADAILDSGFKKTIYVAHGNGFFEPREVETGREIGNRVEITHGLKPGERIALSGTFLIDSESRMELAASGMYETLSKDPVSGVDVSIKKASKAGRKSKYQGKDYYFSSIESKEKFEKDPGKYVKE